MTLLTIMIGYTVLNGEDLVTEDGKAAATTLSLDLETSKIPYKNRLQKDAVKRK